MSGLPGSGKTTLARALASLLTLPVFDKDAILEELFDARGVGDASWRRQLSRDSDALLQARVSASDGAVVASFWHAPGMPNDSGTPTGWLAGLSSTLVNVHCTCAVELAADRYVQRPRHPGHLDDTRSVADVVASIRALPSDRPLGIGEPVVVDTANAVNHDLLVHEVEAAFARGLARLPDC